jgi:hypothetical protein
VKKIGLSKKFSTNKIKKVEVKIKQLVKMMIISKFYS